MKYKAELKKSHWILIIFLLSVLLHAWAVSLLPEDFDEPVYLQNAFDYANAVRTGNWDAVVDYSGTSEHPAFVKLLFAAAILIMGNAATWVDAFYASRIISAIFGTLAVLSVAIAVDPLSGAFLALDTLHLKYTSQVYLEAVPHAMTIAAVLTYLRVKPGRPGPWLFVSAAALGIAAASKYSYLPVILVVLAYLVFFEKKTRIHWLLAYAAVALAVFFLLNVHLWQDPLQRLAGSLSFHVQYSQGAHVDDVGYPWYQPFVWILTSSPAQWHPQVFFYYGFDAIFALLAFAGLPREWKERRWLVIWLLAGIIFLLLWPTKWPQYALTVTPAICMLAAGSARRAYHWLEDQNSYWDYLRNLVPAPGRGLWVAIGAFILFILAIYLSAAAKQSIGQIGWSSINSANSSLPRGSINILLPLQDGTMLAGTSSGLAHWLPPHSSDEEGQWVLYTATNSGLSSDEVLSLAVDADGDWWVGTQAGLNRYNGTTWKTFHSSDLGIPDETILSLAAGEKGELYAGTLDGAAAWNGSSWNPLDQARGEAVFSIVLVNDELWMSVPDGIWRIGPTGGTVGFLPLDAPARQLLVDSKDDIWAATSGAGLALWDGAGWQYFTVANSDIPFNTVNWVAEIQPGELWTAVAYANQPGGLVASFQDGSWHTYQENNSGISGSEPLVIAPNAGQVWIGTRAEGIDSYLLGR